MSHQKTALTVLFLLLLPILARSEETPPERSIRVEGKAEVRVAPDQVILTLGVSTFDAKLGKAKDENDRRVSAIVAAARRSGLTEQQVKTDWLSIEPRYSSWNDPSSLQGYAVRKSVSLTLTALAQFETLLEAVLDAGANHVHGIDFRTSELRKHRDRARELAIVAAREKATALAAQLGQKIGKPLRIEEGNVFDWSPYGWWWGGGWNSSMTQNVIQAAPAAAGGASDGPTVPGQIGVSAVIAVEFELVAPDGTPDT